MGNGSVVSWILQVWPYIVAAFIIYLILFEVPKFFKSRIIKRTTSEKVVEVTGDEELLETVEEEEEEQPSQPLLPLSATVEKPAKKIRKQPYQMKINLLIFKVVEIPLNRAFVVSDLFTGEQKVIFGGEKGGAKLGFLWFYEKVVLIVPTSELLLKMEAQQIFVRSEEEIRNGQSFAVEVDTDVYVRVPSEKEVASKREAILNLATKEIPTIDGVTIDEAGLLAYLREYFASRIRQLAAILTLDELGRISATTLRVWAIDITGSKKEPGLLLQKGLVCTNIVIKQPGISNEVRKAQLLTFEADQRKKAQLTDATADKESAEIRSKGIFAVALGYIDGVTTAIDRELTEEEVLRLWPLATEYAKILYALSGEGDVKPVVVIGSGGGADRVSEATVIAELIKATSQGGA